MARVFLLTVALAALADCSRAGPMLNEGDCRVATPTQQSFGCHVAAFGAFLPTEKTKTPLPLRIARNNMLACSSLSSGTFENAVAIVQRGDCVFQQKLVNVAAAGGIGMVLISTDDDPLQLGTLEYKPIGAFAVSIGRSTGDQLLSLVNQTHAHIAGAEVTVTVSSKLTALDQAWRRIQYLLDINAPLVAYETFYAALPPPMRDIDKVVESILEPTTMKPEARSDRDTINFFHRCMEVFPRQWEFARDASFHAAVGGAALLKGQSVVDEDNLGRLDLLKAGAMELQGRGYYAHAAILLEELLNDSDPAIRCLLAFVHFLRGDIATTLEEAHDCHLQKAQFNVTAADLEVAHTNFLRLLATKMDGKSDQRCVTALASQAIAMPGTKQRNECCRRRIHSRAEEVVLDDDGSPRHTSINRNAYWYQSRFVEELYHTLNIMGVYLDELGAFNESLIFFRHASRLCEDWTLSTEFRRALAIPIVFDSTEAMDGYLAQLHRSIGELRVLRDKQKRVLSSLAGADASVDYFARPEDATYLRYTITPPTMFIGYQGRDVLALQQSVYALRAELFPSLISRFQPLNEIFRHTDKPRRRRVAFVSTWFRNHSVGKLILGVIKRLDRTKFHVMVYRAVHFLGGSDELTKEFHREADSYLELPTDLDDAVALLRHEAIDVLVFPELGMDAWSLFLSHHRVAPVQCVFWGHPITTANPAIDYFITSEYFVSDFFEGDPVGYEDSSTDSWPRTYHGSSFSEQVVLFRGLSTFFTNKFPRGHSSRGFDRSALHLPATARLYLCPQTLMKLHTDFDLVLEAILTRDPHARIVLLSSSSQRVWQEQLRRRFRRRFGEAHRRVVFLPTLPYNDFMGLLSAADVVLDPFPFGGGVTTLDALAVGTPVVTLPSAQTVPQLAAGFLRALGIADTVALSVDEFVSTAVGIAQNAALRRRLRDRILARHDALYEDEATLEDWNAFLDAVDVGVPSSAEAGGRQPAHVESPVPAMEE